MITQQIQFKKPLRGVFTGLAVLLTVLLSSGAHATHFELSRLATQLSVASDQLYHGLRNVHGYSSVRQNASRLSTETRQFVESVNRDRSASQLRSKFNDLARAYSRLETAFLRAHHSRGNAYVYNDFTGISNLFAGLNEVYYYDSVYAANNRVIVQQRQYYAPPVISRRPRVDSHNSGNYGYNDPDRNRQRPNRRDYDSTSVLIPNNFDHRSPVLQRQQNRNQDRTAVQRNRSEQRDSINNRRDAIRGSNSDRRGGTETRRRNHYEN